MKRLLIGFMLLAATADAQTIPRAALQYKRALIGNARIVWGLDAPVALIAGQLEQESGWRADAKSAFAGGLAQFTPGTAKDISAKYPELSDNAPFEPSWALRAVNLYDRDLWKLEPNAANECERFAFTLSAYNGGRGWVVRQKKAAKSAGYDDRKWFGHVENFRVRAEWAHKENRGYPRAILLKRQQKYADGLWGRGVECKGVK
jgi:soluble lytic murein transglycosylase-like protein